MAGARRGIARAVHKGRSQESTAGYSQSQDLAPRADRKDAIAACIVSPSMEAFTVLAVERLAKPTDTLVFGALSFSRRKKRRLRRKRASRFTRPTTAPRQQHYVL